MSERPRNDRGHFVPMGCPRANCGGGKLVRDVERWWVCDGLADPGHPDQPLEPCTFSHRDGDRYQP